MNGIDISRYQQGIDLTKIAADFVIIKATEGTYMRQSVAFDFAAAAEASGKLVGFYHYAGGYVSPEAEAEYFVEYVKPYIGKALLALDWEGDAMKKGAAWAKRWLDRVYDLTGVRAAVYMSKGVTYQSGWADVALIYPLWVAQYANNNPVYGYQDNPWTDKKGYGAWEEPIIFQYTSSGYLPGWGKRLDLDKCYLNAYEWQTLATGKLIERPDVPKKDIGELAEEVLAGKWGNGQERIKALTEAGYSYEEVQAEVNILVAARDVINGKYGNGAERVQKLTAVGLNAAKVQKKVNELLGVKV